MDRSQLNEAKLFSTVRGQIKGQWAETGTEEVLYKHWGWTLCVSNGAQEHADQGSWGLPFSEKIQDLPGCFPMQATAQKLL